MLMATGFISNLFWKLEIAEFIYDSMKWIVIGGLGFTASEQFSNRVKSSSTYISQTKTTSKPKDDVIEITEENEKTDETDVIT